MWTTPASTAIAIPSPGRNALGLLITQSGETADTLAAQREMIALGSKTVAICNVVGAMVAREAHGAIYTHAGPEIGVASTKAFTAQLTALFLLALKLGQLRGKLDTEQSVALIEELSRIPAKIEEVLRSRSAAVRAAGHGILHRARLPLPRPRHPLPHRPRRRAQAQGNLLHPRRGLPRRRNEARPQRPHRRDPARGRARHARRIRSRLKAALREDPLQHSGSHRALRPRHRRGHRGRHDASAAWSSTSSTFRPRPSCCRRSSRSCRCNCWPITSPSAAAATSTSRATWPNPSPWNSWSIAS